MSVVVIGGGLSGLALAWHLREAGTEVTLFEAGPRLGGNIQTRAREHFLLESGPNAFLDREPTVRQLAARLGIAERIRPADPAAQQRFLFTQGRLRELPTSPAALLGSDILPFPARLRVLFEFFSSRQDEHGSQDPFSHLLSGDTTSALLLEMLRAGQPAGGGLSPGAGGPRREALEHSDRRLLLGMAGQQPVTEAGAERLTGTVCSFEGGLSTFIDALARSLEPVAHTNAKVEAVACSEGTWRVLVRDNGRLWEKSARQVVLALPAYAAAQLLRPLELELGRELEGITYLPLTVVHLGYAPGTTPSPQGACVVVPAEENRVLLGTLHVSNVFPWRAEGGRVLYTCMLDGTRKPELTTLPEEALVQLATEELKALLGVSAPPVLTEVVRWPRALPQYTVGHQERMARLDAAVARWPGLTLTGNAYHGVSMPDCIRNAARLAEQLLAGDAPRTQEGVTKLGAVANR